MVPSALCTTRYAKRDGSGSGAAQPVLVRAAPPCGPSARPSPRGRVTRPARASRTAAPRVHRRGRCRAERRGEGGSARPRWCAIRAPRGPIRRRRVQGRARAPAALVDQLHHHLAGGWPEQQLERLVGFGEGRDGGGHFGQHVEPFDAVQVERVGLPHVERLIAAQHCGGGQSVHLHLGRGGAHYAEPVVPRAQRQPARQREVALALALAQLVPQVDTQVSPLALEHQRHHQRRGRGHRELERLRHQLLIVEQLQRVPLADEEPRAERVAQHGQAQVGPVGRGGRHHRRGTATAPFAARHVGGKVTDEATKLGQGEHAVAVRIVLAQHTAGRERVGLDSQPRERQLQIARRHAQDGRGRRRHRAVEEGRQVGDELVKFGEPQKARLIEVVPPHHHLGLARVDRFEPESRQRLPQPGQRDGLGRLGSLVLVHPPHQRAKLDIIELSVAVGVVLGQDRLGRLARRNQEELAKRRRQLTPRQAVGPVAVEARENVGQVGVGEGDRKQSGAGAPLVEDAPDGCLGGLRAAPRLGVEGCEVLDELEEFFKLERAAAVRVVSGEHRVRLVGSRRHAQLVQRRAEL
eukprot:scaffold8023_cov103-Isochrysis_galbana.AAC.16